VPGATLLITYKKELNQGAGGETITPIPIISPTPAGTATPSPTATVIP
jgi:hypothetical protein